MKLSEKYRKLIDSFKFRGDKNSFSGCIWLYSKVLHTLGHFPFNVSMKNDKIYFKECNHSLVYCIIIFILSGMYVLFAHLSMHHSLHHIRHSMITNISLFQISTITVTGVIGAFNSLFMRKNIVKVWQLLICKSCSKRFYFSY